MRFRFEPEILVKTFNIKFLKNYVQGIIYVIVKKPTITETIKLRLCWFGHAQRMEENRIPKRVLYMNSESTRRRGKPRNRWQEEVREDGRIVG
jgi:hypothetical protein